MRRLLIRVQITLIMAYLGCIVACRELPKLELTKERDAGSSVEEISDINIDDTDCENVMCYTPENTCSPNGSLIVRTPVGYCTRGHCEHKEHEEICETGKCKDGVCARNPCQGVTCNRPPNSVCIDKYLQVYGARGYCENVEGYAVCKYSKQLIDCESPCDKGTCQGDPCIGVVCDKPPAAYCRRGDGVLVRYQSGYCEGGKCQYKKTSRICSEGCIEDRCAEDDPCSTLRCDVPPANYCVGDSLRVFQAESTCKKGICAYKHTDILCPKGCKSGQCEGDPCVGVFCNDYYANSCSDGKTLVVWNTIPGTCKNGNCTYNSEMIDCVTSCQDGRCLDNPCAGVICDNPGPSFCEGMDAVHHSVQSICNYGQCLQETFRSPCSVGCQDGQCTKKPVINSIDADGANMPINPISDDADYWISYESIRKLSSHRIDSDNPILRIEGSNLTRPISVKAVGQFSQGTIFFDIEEATMNTLKVKFPSKITVVGAGLFLLIVTTVNGEADAQIFFLQGEPGIPGKDGTPCDQIVCDGTNCTLNQNLTVDGRVVSKELIVNGTHLVPECPTAYTKDTQISNFIVCKKGLDEMVKVGNFWIDRYEMSIWSNSNCKGGSTSEIPFGAAEDDYDAAGFPDTGNWTSPLYGCSIKNVAPSRFITWFQAQQACVLSGKHLCTNAQWQAAAQGTPDPHSSAPDLEGEEPCNIWENRKPKGSFWALSETTLTILTGSANSCQSLYGSYDMIGNIWEWTSNWYGQGDDANDGSQSITYYFDGYWNSDISQSTSSPGYFPPAVIRGGAYNLNQSAGIFSMDFERGVSDNSSSIGARCCI